MKTFLACIVLLFCNIFCKAEPFRYIDRNISIEIDKQPSLSDSGYIHITIKSKNDVLTVFGEGVFKCDFQENSIKINFRNVNYSLGGVSSSYVLMAKDSVMHYKLKVPSKLKVTAFYLNYVYIPTKTRDYLALKKSFITTVNRDGIKSFSLKQMVEFELVNNISLEIVDL